MNPNHYLMEAFTEAQPPVLFIDFDGTISKRDVIDCILEEFADRRWLEIEQKWVKGELGSRECLRKQFALVRAAPDKLNEFIDTQEIDEGFLPLLGFCREAGIETYIISDGFEYYIRRMLERYQVLQSFSNVKIWANQLIPHRENRWQSKYPYFGKICADGCATCKPAVMKRQNQYAAPSIFIGDGLSDRFAAKTANIVFAKNRLSEFCLENQIPQTAYTSLKQVAECLDQAFESFVCDSPGGLERRWLRAA